MKAKILISVVMPLYNAEKFLHDSINSILSQTIRDFELILINDASTDKTLQIIKDFKRKDKRIRIINNKKNLQMANSLNIGIKHAKTGIIARMDQDDIALPNRLALQYLFLKQHPEITIVGNNILIIDEKNKIIGKRTYPTTSDQLKKIMLRYSPFAHPTVMFKKKAFQEVGDYNPNKHPCEDIDFWFRLGKKHQFASIPLFLLKYRLLSTSSSHHNILDTELAGFRIKIHAIRYYNITPGLYDIFYNLLQFISAWLMPSNIRIKVYNLLRGNNLI